MTVTDLHARLAGLAPMDVATRLDRLRATFGDAGIDALVVTAASNVRYLTGFTGSAGIVVVTERESVLVTDGRYTEQASAQIAASGAKVRVEITATDANRILAGVLTGSARVGLEAEHLSWARQRQFAQDWSTAHELIATSGLVEDLRRTKDDGELDRMETAAAIADAALAAQRSRLLDGPTEAEFAGELDAMMRRLGASKPSFDTIVASGPNGALPHARPSSRRIVEGDLVVIDFGAVVDGYCSDMTRTIVVGEPRDMPARMLRVVTEAQAAGVAAVVAGVAASAVDASCRAVIDDAGWGDAFSHGTGHGVGLDIHEAPRVGTTSDATLRRGDVVTVEPGVYLPGIGGVRVEDTVVVTADGCRPLTHSPKSPTP